MNKTSLGVAALLALAIAACQQPDETNIAVDAVNNLDASEMVLPPDDGSAAAQGTPAPAPTAGQAKLPTRIPDQFHGRWGINLADCTSTKGDAKGLLTINDARLTFYEARGTLDRVIGATADSFDANYGFSGEGQTWERVERLKLVNGKMIRRTDAAAGQEPPVNLTYTRCA